MGNVTAIVVGGVIALLGLVFFLQGIDPTYQNVFNAGWAGTIRTIADLAGTWAVDPEYANKIVNRAVAIYG